MPGARSLADAGMVNEPDVPWPAPFSVSELIYRVNQFSGGNQQKVVLAKWMANDPRLLLLDEPTQGIDAGAKFDVLQLICDAASAGAAVVIASGDYEQLAHVCHRVFVLRYGRIVAELSGAELTESAIAGLSQSEGVSA